MAHFAKLNDENIVIAVHVVNNDVLLKADGTESELKGKQFLNSLHGTAKWVQTSYNGNFRKNFAGIGFTYDSDKDAFIPQKPFNSWILNEDTLLWESPIPYPSDGKTIENINGVSYIWNEDLVDWQESIIED